MPYEKVQFIAYCINTAPKKALGKQVYTGLNSDITDIAERIKLVRKAIETARDHANTKKADPTVLKIFMMPEFFFRGKTGGYSLDAILGQVDPKAPDHPDPKSLVGQLQLLVQHSDWEHWLFIFGSIVGKSFQTQEAESGKKLVPGQNLQGTQIDSSKLIEVYNYVLVQKGGTTAGPQTAHIVLKQFKSPEDFITQEKLLYDRLNRIKSRPGGKVLGDEQVDHLAPSTAPSSASISDPSFSGTSLFKQGSFQFGLEICLDHFNARLVKYLPKLRPRPTIDIQLLPSCGMNIQKPAIVVREGGFIFNCDGKEAFSQVMQIKSQDKISSETKSKPLESLLGTGDYDKETFRKVASEKRGDPVETLLALDRQRFLFPDKTKLIPIIKHGRPALWAEDLEASSEVMLDPTGVFSPGIQIGLLFAEDAGKIKIYPEQAMPTVSTTASLFPHIEEGMAFALADEPILINGMKVIFDQTVPVYPVTLVRKDSLQKVKEAKHDKQ